MASHAKQQRVAHAAPLVEQLSEEQLAEFREAFELFDKDNDGVISADELKHVMIFLGQHPTDDDVQDMVAEVDLDGDGQINFTDFANCLITGLDAVPDEDIAKAFCAFDVNDTGYITVRTILPLPLSRAPRQVLLTRVPGCVLRGRRATWCG